jgi:dihydropteroate synthase
VTVNPTLRLGHRDYAPSPERPLLMGVVNAAPDSFSDGGRWRGAGAQAARARELVAAGADLIDVGGESGRTDRPASPVAEEIRRSVPLVERLAAEGVAVSVDTWRAEVVEAALAAGAVLINDVGGLRDPRIADLCAAAGAGLVLVHSGAPPKVKAAPGFADVAAAARAFLARRLALATERGVAAESIVVDPGPDLGKTPAETVELVRRVGELRALRRPILLAASRKDFIGAITGRRPRERLAGTLAAVAAGLDAGASILRVHDVAEVADYLKVRDVLAGRAAAPAEPLLAEHLRREQEPAA